MELYIEIELITKERIVLEDYPQDAYEKGIKGWYDMRAITIYEYPDEGVEIIREINSQHIVSITVVGE